MRRNPYLILGVDYGAPNAAASKAFARASRRLRNDPDAPVSVEDLTWALQQVEHENTDPESSVDYFRVPADPTAYEVTATEGVMLMPVVPLTRRTGPISEEEMTSLVAEILTTCETTMVNELPLVSTAYGLGIDLGVPPPIGEELPLMTDALAGERQQAISAMTLEAGKYSPSEITEKLSQLSSLGIDVTTGLALAMLGSPASPDEAVEQLAQVGDDKAVAAKAVTRASSSPALLAALAASPSAIVRGCVAASPDATPEIRKLLRGDAAPEVAAAAKAASPKTARNVGLVVAALVLLLVILAIVLIG